MTLQIIEWPAAGMGSWWVVEHTEGRGYFPLSGPHGKRRGDGGKQRAEKALEKIREERGDGETAA